MKPTYQHKLITAYCGDALEVMQELPAESVQCCITSPPYWSLRDYNLPGQLGMKRLPEEYVARMVEYFREVRRLLRADGTLWLNIGDTYATFKGACKNPGGGEKSFGKQKKAAGVIPKFRGSPNRMLPRGHGGLKPKDLVGIPWMLAFALRTDGWWLRSEIIWHKSNPQPESTPDRPSRAHEKMFLLSKSERYYYDEEAVKEPVTGNAHSRGHGLNPKARKVPEGWNTGPGAHTGKVGRYGAKQNPDYSAALAGSSPSTKRSLRDVWTIPTQPYPGAHYSTFPPRLVAPGILAGTSERGCCPECGAPWTRDITREANYEQREPAQTPGNQRDKVDSTGWRPSTITEHGWLPGCECGGEPVPCVVLDPFGGTGTTGQVARELGRRAILIELNSEDIEIRMRKRFAQELLPL